MARIIVIDDQDPIRRLLRRTLEQDGHEVLEASEGEMGMQLLRRGAAEVVITDIFMPVQNGIQTLRQIRKEFPDVKVIVISGGRALGDWDLKDGAELLGAVKTLQKPFTAREVIDTVRAVLG